MKHLVEIAWEWGVRCFGLLHMNNSKVRALRTIEEVVELGQALGVPQDMVHLLVTTVYSRPSGDHYQEMGGSMVTLMCLIRSFEYDPETVFLDEIQRCLTKDPEHFRKRNQDKEDLGLRA